MIRKIRVRYGYVDDIIKALLKVRDSDKYEKFCSFLAPIQRKYRLEITSEEILAFNDLKLDLWDKIKMELIREILEKRLAPHVSKIELKQDMAREPAYREHQLVYRKCAIKRVETFARILQKNALKIIPECSCFLKQELETLVKEFQETRRLPIVQRKTRPRSA